ncbi:MAG: chlorophyll synthase ChlG [Maricaulaceae bacterium]
MTSAASSAPASPRAHPPVAGVPHPLTVLELLKPVTWFPPMWALACGVVSAGGFSWDRLVWVFGAVLLAGPLVCGTSQVVNDWFDREVDAINEPNRPIPSGRAPGRSAFWIALIMTAVSAGVAALLGLWVFLAGLVGLALAWGYSAPPFRFKRSGIWGPLSVGLSYEGLAWFTGAAASLGAFPGLAITGVAVLYSLGAHGIMTINDFKAIEGDRAMGLRSLPAVLGPERAARIACFVMAVPQVVVIGLLVHWGHPIQAGVVTASLILQFACMARWMGDPKGRAPWYNATGVTLYVLGMMATATALGASA